MTWHLLKLVWNRKRTTLLVMTEIAAAFLVLFAVAAFATYVFDNWRRPIGCWWRRRITWPNARRCRGPKTWGAAWVS